jgi:hypothetical protein
MHLHTYRDESRSRHFDLIGGGNHLWTIDLVVVAVSAVLGAGLRLRPGGGTVGPLAPQGRQKVPVYFPMGK